MERAFTAIERIERRVEKLERSGWESSHSAKWVDRAIVAAITVGGMALLRTVGIG
jgi:hypothetical protein